MQAGMGGGLATSALAAAVSDGGGLGTIGILPPDALRAEIAAVRALTSKPLAVNLIVPFARRGALGGRERGGRRRHPLGSVAETAHAEDVDPHRRLRRRSPCGGRRGRRRRHRPGCRGRRSRARHGPGARAPRPGAEGGRSRASRCRRRWHRDAADVQIALEAGAAAAVAGTAFLATDESRAHDGYKQRLVESDETVLTELFGHGLAARAASRPAQRSNSSLAEGRPARTGRGARLARRDGRCRTPDAHVRAAADGASRSVRSPGPHAVASGRRHAVWRPSTRIRCTPARRWPGSPRSGPRPAFWTT